MLCASAEAVVICLPRALDGYWDAEAFTSGSVPG